MYKIMLRLGKYDNILRERSETYEY